MSFPKYYASYCTSDTEAGSNPFWHSFLLMSVQKTPDGPIEVTDCVGYYSQPTTTKNPVTKGIKQLIGLKVDLQDGHGVLKREMMRTFDGNGLHGVSFEASPEQFEALQTLYNERIKQEEIAIEELNRRLRRQNIPTNGYTRYITEKSLAASAKRPPRLRPFHITMNVSFSRGFDSTSSYTCKNEALDLLLQTSIIDKDTQSKILGGRGKYAFPRCTSLHLGLIRLVSTGEPVKEVTRKNKVFYNRQWGNNQLFWASPLHLHEKTPHSKAELKAIEKHHQLLKNILTRIRKVETALLQKINEIVHAVGHKNRLEPLRFQLRRVQHLYDTFSLSHENQLTDCFQEKLWRAEKALNVATMAITPDRVNHPFILRAYESIAIRNATYSLLCLLVAAICLTGPIGTTIMAASAIYAGYQLHRFFKEEVGYKTMRSDYLTFQQHRRNQAPITVSNEPVTEKESRAATPA